MNKNRRPILATVLLCDALSVPASATSVNEVDAQIDSVLSDHAGFAEAFKVLQADIADGTRMAMEFEYPLITTVNH